MPTRKVSFQNQVSWLAGSQSIINEEGPIHSVPKGCGLAMLKPETWFLIKLHGFEGRIYFAIYVENVNFR